MERSITTLFMLMSVDGKISTGANADFDFDRDLPDVAGVKEGLPQYYEIEQSTDLWSLNSGRVQAKIGINEMPLPSKTPVSFVLIDNHHLSEHGVRVFCAKSKEFVLITTNPQHPSFRIHEDNLHIILQEKLNQREALHKLKTSYHCDRLTIQSGGTLNALFLKEQLFDCIDLVIAPLLVGGKDTATLIDGISITQRDELKRLGVLKLERADVLKDSYLRLHYLIIHE